MIIANLLLLDWIQAYNSNMCGLCCFLLAGRICSVKNTLLSELSVYKKLHCFERVLLYFYYTCFMSKDLVETPDQSVLSRRGHKPICAQAVPCGHSLWRSQSYDETHQRVLARSFSQRVHTRNQWQTEHCRKKIWVYWEAFSYLNFGECLLHGEIRTQAVQCWCHYLKYLCSSLQLLI